MDFGASAKRVILYGILSAAFLLPFSAYATSSVPTFSQNYQLWNEGPDILALQQWLNANGYPVAQIGVGSPGHETDIFGPHTYRALVRFQAAHQLPQTGYLWPLTRAAINSLLSSVGASSTGTGGVGSNTIPTTPGTTTATTPSVAATSTRPALTPCLCRATHPDKSSSSEEETHLPLRTPPRPASLSLHQAAAPPSAAR